MGLEEKSYRIHAHSFDKLDAEQELSTYKNWFDRSTTDLWRHTRMLSVLLPFLENQKNSSWLTVGDGRFGTSAMYIDRMGGKALASDIDLNLLQVAKENSMIRDFAYANAEKLPFADESFDYAYCKQSYHHFPRPALAVYEMLRVSKRAIVFTEPHDFSPSPVLRTVLQKIKHGLKTISGKTNTHHDTGNYEPIGNYIYTISVREFEKMAQGLGLPCIAYKRFNDIYFSGVEKEIFSEQATLYKKIKRAMAIKKTIEFLGLAFPNTIQMVVFKTMPENKVLDAFKRDGYTIVRFSPNPYL